MAGRSWDVSGVATKYGIKCSDGRTILNGAFDDQDGVKVPVKWAHDKSDPTNVLGYAILHSCDGGMRGDTYFDESSTKSQYVKGLIEHGTPLTYSIHATDLVQRGMDVVHGIIKELSIVTAGANPGAVIDSLALAHADGYYSEEEALISFGELLHSDESGENLDTQQEGEGEAEEPENQETATEEPAKTEETSEGEGEESGDGEAQASEGSDNSEGLSHADEDPKEKSEEDDDETIDDVLHTMNDKQLKVCAALVGMASQENEGGKEMAHTNIFESQGTVTGNGPLTLSHADKLEIMNYAAKAKSFKTGLQDWIQAKLSNDDEFAHGLEQLVEIRSDGELSHAVLDNESFTYLLPEFKNVNGEGNRELWTDDMSWVNEVVSGAHKVPFARVKTETIDARGLRAKGWKKGDKKTPGVNATVLHRETTPTMVYAKEEVSRQDILELKGNFEYVPFIRQLMQLALKYELAYDTLFGDGREVGEDGKVSEENIRPIWKDDELFTIHVDLDVDAMAASLQGTDTNTYFGDGFVESEAMVKVILDALIDYRGRGNMVAFMDPREVNKLLLARDRNGRRIYDSKDDLAKALNVRKIEEVQQIADLEPRTQGEGQNARKKKLVALLINMQDYAYGNVQGGEVTHFENFDIDYNNYKYLDETYLSGAMRRIKSAIAIEIDVTDSF